MEKLAREILGTDNIRKKAVPEINGWYFWEPMRGGKALMVDDKGNKLGATSAVGFEKHLLEFKKRFR